MSDAGKYHSRRRYRCYRLLAAALMVLSLVGCVREGSHNNPGTTSASSASASSSQSITATSPSPGPTLLARRPGLAVKIDNTRAAAPRIGLSAADVVYVEPVEAGLTRLLAIFASQLPSQVGPIRSARESDVALLANYGAIPLAYSGASRYTQRVLARGSHIDVGYERSRVGYRRERSRRAPYNVIGFPQALIARAKNTVPPRNPGFQFGPWPTSGKRAVAVSTSWRASTVAFTYHAASRRYLISTDGRSEIDAATRKQASAATIVVQQVRLRTSRNKDVNGSPTPVAGVLGTGSVTVIREGQAKSGTWQRLHAQQPTTFTDTTGQTLTMATGPVWVLLVPRGQMVNIT